MAIKSEKGFSTLEMIICAILVGMTVTAVMPRIINTDKLRLKYEGIYMINTMRKIQAESNTESLKEGFPKKYMAASSYVSLYKNSCRFYSLNNQGRINVEVHELPADFSIKGNNYQNKYYFVNNAISKATTITISKNAYKVFVIIDSAGRIRLDDNFNNIS